MSTRPKPASAGANQTERCPVRDVLDHIGDQWSFLALLSLAGGTLRFSVLQRTIGDISKRMLAETLRRLERDGYAQRTVYASVPPKVEYKLTPLGRSLVQQLQPLVSWADTHHAQVRKARKAYTPPAKIPAL